MTSLYFIKDTWTGKPVWGAFQSFAAAVQFLTPIMWGHKVTISGETFRNVFGPSRYAIDSIPTGR